MEITIKISKSVMRDVKEVLPEDTSDKAALAVIKRVVQNFVETEDLVEDIFEGIGDDDGEDDY